MQRSRQSGDKDTIKNTAYTRHPKVEDRASQQKFGLFSKILAASMSIRYIVDLLLFWSVWTAHDAGSSCESVSESTEQTFCKEVGERYTIIYKRCVDTNPD